MPLCPSHYMPQNQQNIIIKTALKHDNQFISVRTEAIRWLHFTIDTGMKLKVETIFKERDKKLLDFITIDVRNIEKQHPSSQ